MRIQYISDIHLEFYQTLPDNLVVSGAKILCLAGDIGYPYSAIYEQFLCKVNRDFEKVFLITGNHEYYSAKGNRHHTMEEIEERIKQIIRDLDLKNITYLDNDYEDYEGFRFVGSTLWSKCDNGEGINDFRIIKEMSVVLYNELHEVSRYFLESEIVTESSLPVIVITHYLPSYRLIADQYMNNKAINMFFASDSDDLFVPTIKCWIYGHTHTGSEKELNGIKFVCNPVGYPGENGGQLIQKIFEV